MSQDNFADGEGRTITCWLICDEDAPVLPIATLIKLCLHGEAWKTNEKRNHKTIGNLTMEQAGIVKRAYKLH